MAAGPVTTVLPFIDAVEQLSWWALAGFPGWPPGRVGRPERDSPASCAVTFSIAISSLWLTGSGQPCRLARSLPIKETDDERRHAACRRAVRHARSPRRP